HVALERGKVGLRVHLLERHVRTPSWAESGQSMEGRAATALRRLAATRRFCGAERETLGRRGAESTFPRGPRFSLRYRVAATGFADYSTGRSRPADPAPAST